jgi:hypothetical protein
MTYSPRPSPIRFILVFVLKGVKLHGWQKIKPLNFNEIQGLDLSCLFLKWYHQESNRGHKDFQSFALPTELWHHPDKSGQKHVFSVLSWCKGKQSFFNLQMRPAIFPFFCSLVSIPCPAGTGVKPQGRPGRNGSEENAG